MKKDEVLKIDVENFKTKEDCPSYSTGFDEKNNYCKFHFFCKNETCSTVDEKGFVEFDNKTLKAYTCSFSGSPIPGDISCTSDSECLSNNCYKNHCHRKNAMPRIECIVSRQYDNKTSTYKPSMYCNKAENEDCSRDDECFSNICIHSKENSTRYYCGPIDGITTTNNNKGKLIIFIVLFFVCIMVIGAFVCGLKGGSGSGSGRSGRGGGGSSSYYYDSGYSGGGGDCGGGDCGGE